MADSDIFEDWRFRWSGEAFQRPDGTWYRSDKMDPVTGGGVRLFLWWPPHLARVLLARWWGCRHF